MGAVTDGEEGEGAGRGRNGLRHEDALNGCGVALKHTVQAITAILGIRSIASGMCFGGVR